MKPRTDRSPFFKFAFWATLVFLVFFCFLKRDNLIRWIGAGFTISRQNRQIELYKQEIKELDRQIESLSTDKDSLETFARENFYFAVPGDDVYIIED